MKITYDPSNFVLIFQNSNVINSIYCFIRVSPEYISLPTEIKGLKHKVMRKYFQPNPSGLTIEIEPGKKVIMSAGSTTNKRNFGTKSEWVMEAIDGRLSMFNKKDSYLYLHEGKTLGIYNFEEGEFTAFFDNELAIKTMHEFFYKMMQLSDKTINWQSSQVNQIRFEPSSENSEDELSDDDCCAEDDDDDDDDEYE
jgi:hypothetical protein